MLNLILSIDDGKVTQMFNHIIFSGIAFTKKCLPFINCDEAINYFQQLTKIAYDPYN